MLFAWLNTSHLISGNFNAILEKSKGMRAGQMNKIAKLGIELEGRWHSKKSAHKPDGSVSVSCPSSCEQRGSYGQYNGELASRPILIRSLDKWIENNYADHVNSSCGMHVHFSLTNPADYVKLMHKEFHEFFKDSFRKWGTDNEITNEEFWKRLEGKNSFCADVWDAENQFKGYGCRYSHLNFCAYEKHGTIECRMLPMFKRKENAIKAIWHLVSIVNLYLARPTKNDLALSEEVCFNNTDWAVESEFNINLPADSFTLEEVCV